MDQDAPRPSRITELVDAVGPTARNPHDLTYSLPYQAERGSIARAARAQIASDRAIERVRQVSAGRNHR